MFRKPRTAIKETTEQVIPSRGRPPTPPQSPHDRPYKQEIQTMAAVMTPSARSPAALKANGASTPVEKEKRAANRNNKAKGSGNASILSFFKKVDVLNGSGLSGVESLFLEDDASTVSPHFRQGDDSQRSSAIDDMASLPIAVQDSARFNELDAPSKRRKLSHSPVAEVNDFDQEQSAINCDTKAAVTQHSASADGGPSRELDTALLKAEAARPRMNGGRSVGPFLDDSDSEDDADLFKKARQADILDPSISVVKTEPEKEEEPQVKTVVFGEEHLEDDNHTRDMQIPRLKREGTSHAEGLDDGFADFEGMGDFEDDYAEGDEFRERRAMMMQRRLEMGEEGMEDDFDEEEFANGDEDNEEIINGKEEPQADTGRLVDATSMCPICNVSFAGVSDQDASVHVNNCLDGNPTPLPTSQSTLEHGLKPEEEPQPASAKFKRPVRPAKPGQESPFMLGTNNGTSSAFSKLMSGHAEDAAWATAAAAEHAARGKPAFQRTCPFYKILPGLNICVDAFRYGAVEGCNAYFLSHFHSDHYIGLTSTWCHGPIYCSRATGNLVRQQLRVDAKWVVSIGFEEKVEVPGTNGTFVTMIPANHCPGSSLFLFEKVVGTGKKPKVQRILHCGDFRACPAHIEHPLLKPDVMDAITGKTAQQKIDVCYLDTTYLNPKYAFPSQEDVIQACSDMCVSLNKSVVDKSDSYEQMKTERAGRAMAKFVRKSSKDDSATDITEDSSTIDNAPPTSTDTKSEASTRGRLLVVVGTYSIGKERICLGIARALNSKIYAPPGKQRICAALEDPELNTRLTTDPRAAQVHMTPLFEIRAETLADYLAEFGDHFSRCVGFRPSGWNYRPPGSRFVESPSVSTVLYSANWKSNYSMRDLVPQRGSTKISTCYGVPYSEHSSFRELTMFCCALRIEKIIPTVNVGSAKSREKMKTWCERWSVERRKNGLFRIGRKGKGEGEGPGMGVGEFYPGGGTWELRTTL